jgi:hypothetical protein
MHYIKSGDYKSRQMQNFEQRHLEAFDAAMRSGFKHIDGSTKREAFNFPIQAMGAFFTKTLQSRICREFIPAGAVVKLAGLPLLPTLNVHDELHFYVMGESTKERLDKVKGETLREINKMLNDGKITMSFDVARSWADKA